MHVFCSGDGQSKRRDIMNYRFRATLAALPACGVLLLGGGEARAQGDLAIHETFVNEGGDLEMSFSDVLPAPMTMRYDAHAIAELTYVCADASRRPLRENRFRQTLRAIVERNVQFSTGFMGQVQGFATLNYPRNQENLSCPPGTSPTLASVSYSDIWVRNQLGVSAGARKVSHVFIRLPGDPLSP
jgi:hypothetical protein